MAGLRPRSAGGDNDTYVDGTSQSQTSRHEHGGRHETILRSGPPRRRLSLAFENRESNDPHCMRVRILSFSVGMCLTLRHIFLTPICHTKPYPHTKGAGAYYRFHDQKRKRRGADPRRLYRGHRRERGADQGDPDESPKASPHGRKACRRATPFLRAAAVACGLFL